MRVMLRDEVRLEAYCPMKRLITWKINRAVGPFQKKG
jgi:hypothetical protein